MQYNRGELHACRHIIGKNLKQLRLAQHMPLEQCSAQEQFSVQEQCSVQNGLGLIYIHKLEKGKTSPRLNILFRFACCLDVSLEELFKDAGPRK